MEKYHIYKVWDSKLAKERGHKTTEDGLYIGMTTDPEGRERRHRGRDFTIIEEYEDKKEALARENELKEEYGLSVEGFTSETARKIAREWNLKRAADGTNPFSGPENNQKRIEDGTHNLLGPISIWSHPDHGDFEGRLMELVRAFPDPKLNGGALSRVRRGKLNHHKQWSWVRDLP